MQYATGSDGGNRCALVALDPQAPQQIIGLVSYDRDPGTTAAEYAATVEDRWQNHGIGSALTRLLIAQARAEPITHLYTLVLLDNLPMLRLLRGLSLPLQMRWEGDFRWIAIDIRIPQAANLDGQRA